MSDQDLMTDVVSTDVQAAGGDAAEKKSFLGTGTQRMVIIIGGLVVLAVVLGIVAALVMFVFTGSGGDDVEVTITTEQTETSTETTETVEVATPADEVSNSEVFTFRDIFEPLLVVVVEETTTTVSTTETDTVNTTVSGTLYLTDIYYQDGQYMAVFMLDGVTYTLTDGERVGTSAWQVVTVRSDSVIMLFGDVQVTLTVGQGITK